MESSQPSRSSRRELLRKAGIGAAVAWTAPVVLSSPAAAQGTAPPLSLPQSNWVRTNQQSATVAYPVGTQPGDLLLAFGAVDAAMTTLQPPAGWTPLTAPLVSSFPDQQLWTQVWWRFAEAETSVTITASVKDGKLAAGVLQFAGGEVPTATATNAYNVLVQPGVATVAPVQVPDGGVGLFLTMMSDDSIGDPPLVPPTGYTNVGFVTKQQSFPYLDASAREYPTGQSTGVLSSGPFTWHPAVKSRTLHVYNVAVPAA